MIKFILYLVVIPVVVICFDSVNLNAFFKKGQSNYYQARIIYMMLVVGLSYLVVSFLNDFMGVFN